MCEHETADMPERSRSKRGGVSLTDDLCANTRTHVFLRSYEFKALDLGFDDGGVVDQSFGGRSS